MDYELPQMSREEFTEFHEYVRACFDQGRQRFNPELRRITTDPTGFDPEHEAYLKTTESLAVCMEGRGDYQEQFDIWVNPSYKEDSARFRLTLAHELTHGYAGLKYGHNAHWRRWYYRVLYHLHSAGFIEGPSIGTFMVQTESRYNTVSLLQGNLLIQEAVEKADSEHNTVTTNYLKRMIECQNGATDVN